MTSRRPSAAPAKLAVSRRTSMTIDEAREVLGFPPGSAPTDREINKVWRDKAREAHPDRGGSQEEMVELNVAKEVLEGKRVNDRTEVGTAAKQRRLDLAAIEEAKARATSAMSPVVGRFNAILFPGWRLNLREWLVDTYADQLDGMQELAEKSVKGATGEDERVWKGVERYCGDLASQALRISSKLGSLSKRLQRDGKPTVSGLDVLCADLTKTLALFSKLHKTSGALMTHLNRTETVPFATVEAFHDNHSMLDSFKTDFDRSGTRANDCDLTDVSTRVRAAVTSVLEILERRRSQTSSLPAWDQWNAGTFDQATTLVDRRTNARLVARYLARQKK